MIKVDIFKVRAYGFGELAQLYFASITKKSANAQLRRWIKLSDTVLSEKSSLVTSLEIVY
jgi:hypothetical protein